MITKDALDRLYLLAALERSRKFKVVPFYDNPNNEVGMITERTAELFAQTLEQINPYSPLEIIIDSHGGFTDAAWRIALAVRSRQGQTRVVIPEKAKSGATLIALGANEILMLEDAELGPLDPQVDYGGQLVSALDLIKSPDPVLKSKAERFLNQIKEYIALLVRNPQIVEKLANRLLLLDQAHPSHSSPVFLEEAKKLGLNARAEMDLDIRALHQLYKKSKFCEHDECVIIEFMPFKVGSRELHQT